MFLRHRGIFPNKALRILTKKSQTVIVSQRMILTDTLLGCFLPDDVCLLTHYPEEIMLAEGNRSSMGTGFGGSFIIKVHQLL